MSQRIGRCAGRIVHTQVVTQININGMSQVTQTPCAAINLRQQNKNKLEMWQL